MFQHYEKKLNKWLLNFIIWWSYLGDYGQRIVDYVRDFVVDAYKHLTEQWKLFQKRYRN